MHHPTDCNLLWDALRKSIDLGARLCPHLGGTGWRKHKHWRKKAKSLCRRVEDIARRGNKAGGNGLKEAVGDYLQCAREIEAKVSELLSVVVVLGPVQHAWLLQVRYFHGHVVKHIDLVERRLLKGEKIPHGEKVFSLFEAHTEMIKKGKARPPIEFGHRLMITSLPGGLIVDYRILGSGTGEADAVGPLADRLEASVSLERIASMSFDRGFSSMAMRRSLGSRIGGGEAGVVMPKKGPPSKVSTERERADTWVELRDAHSAVESDINSLEHHGLGRCPDRGEEGYRRYAGLGVLSYNLHKIGNSLLRAEQAQAA